MGQRLRGNTKRGQLMKNLFQYILYLIICVSSFSCSSDLKFALPEVDPLLSVQSFADPDDKFKLTVTMARPIQEQNIQMDRDCQVKIYENDLFFTSLNLDPSKYIQGTDTQRLLRFFVDPNVLFSENKEYKVEVKYPGFEPVIAKSFKPNAVKIKEVTYKRITGDMPEWYYSTPRKLYSGTSYPYIDPRDTSLIEFTIVIDDPIETANFYRIGINMVGSNNNPRLQYASTENPEPVFMKYSYHKDNFLNPGATENLYTLTYEILWNDNEFNGLEHSFKILVSRYTYTQPNTQYIISLYTLNEDYYNYMLNRWKFFKTEDDPFAEPIRYYSNSSNGCGIFAFSSMDTDTIKFK